MASGAAETLGMQDLWGPGSQGQMENFSQGTKKSFIKSPPPNGREASVISELKSLGPDNGNALTIQPFLVAGSLGEGGRGLASQAHQPGQAMACRIPPGLQPRQSLWRETGPGFAFQELTDWCRKLSPAIMVKRGDHKSPIPSQHAGPLKGNRVSHVFWSLRRVILENKCPVCSQTCVWLRRPQCLVSRGLCWLTYTRVLRGGERGHNTVSKPPANKN